MAEFLSDPMMKAVLGAVSILLLITVGILAYTVFKMEKRLNRFMGVKSKRHNIEEILTDYYFYVENIDEKCKALENNVNILFERIKPCVQKVGVVRYNPFDNMGGDLSYAIAFLDEEDNGILLNTIFTREASHTYCKPVEGGKSEYTLCYEEQEAIKRAKGIETRPRRTREQREEMKVTEFDEEYSNTSSF